MRLIPSDVNLFRSDRDTTLPGDCAIRITPTPPSIIQLGGVARKGKTPPGASVRKGGRAYARCPVKTTRAESQCSQMRDVPQAAQESQTGQTAAEFVP
jgi:hypothetical protein